ncbi:MAG: bifunctional adenosylcobinamide kinase/adenosylcobinamide-phosphate guanylyltransferase [Deltaproteobacteria bacterium]|nr:bifunctional adenosylcobinamide kinase/adenosylcobinamide-phosphate guanylyltransferase [Deltaproteobacteria bacterium]
MTKIFITGGISSGKSSFAEETALSLYKSLSPIAAGASARRDLTGQGQGGGSLHFIATAKAGILDEGKYEDEEMALKIKKHKDKRNKDFIVHENFEDLSGEVVGVCKSLALSSAAGKGVILIDSMTLWLSSIFRDIAGYNSALESVIKFSAYLSKIECSVITVADSLGFNMVPVSAYVRKFIELNGLMEQELSAVSDKAYCVIAGNPITLK